MKKIKLLIVGAFPPPNSPVVGGIVTTCKILMESDFPNHFDVILIDSTQRSNPPPSFFIRLCAAVIRTCRYLSVLVIKRPEAVILFTAVGASVAEKGLMAWMARLISNPVFFFPRGAALIDEVRSNCWQKIWIVPAMKGATHILCQGPTWHNFAIEDLGFSKEAAPIIYNWSATKDLLRLGSQRSRRHNSENLKILFLGWLEKEKGIFELLEACRKLSSRYVFCLTVAGSGNAENKARAFVLEHNLQAYIKIVGWTHGLQKMKLLASADILVLPSWAEGFPNSIIEAMAARIAVIVSAVGNVPDILQHRDQAMIVPPRDVNTLTKIIEELLVNPGFRLKLADRGYNFARENFSTEKGVQNFISIIKFAIANHRNSS
jgi:glycosyltransferase involved in cell wall biosynthesis